ncbi:MAG: phage virion morphogenesis protein [Candidatus Riflebacteria bacterium]|nr:phage virion morphogenesis protein [Candidatus Riflebacteria bacterium]
MNENMTIIVNDASVQQLLQQIKGKVSNLKPIMQVIGEIIRTSVDENFEQGGRYSSAGSWEGGSNKWEPLKASTIKAKRKSRFPGNILKDTGRLAASIEAKATRDQVKIGTNVVYAAIHQFGGTLDIPARQRDIAFRRTKSGATMKQKNHPNLWMFAGKKHKNVFFMQTMSKAYKITIPARPFLVVQNQDLDQIKEHLLNYIADITK